MFVTWLYLKGKVRKLQIYLKEKENIKENKRENDKVNEEEEEQQQQKKNEREKEKKEKKRRKKRDRLSASIGREEVIVSSMIRCYVI